MPDFAGDESPPAPPAPSPSRVRDALLGGRRNLQCDRDLARRLERTCPGTAGAAADVRAFTARAVTWCAWQGIAQFIITEPGLPLPGAADAARAVIADARVAYVTTDPSETAYARAAATRDDMTAAVFGGGGPAELLADPALRAVISLERPVCAVLTAGALMDATAAKALAAGFARMLAGGSALVMSAWAPRPGPTAEDLAAAFAPAGRIIPHTAAELGLWLSGERLSLVDPPGVTDVRRWRAGMPCPGPQPGGSTVSAGAVALVTGD